MKKNKNDLESILEEALDDLDLHDSHSNQQTNNLEERTEQSLDTEDLTDLENLLQDVLTDAEIEIISSEEKEVKDISYEKNNGPNEDIKEEKKSSSKKREKKIENKRKAKSSKNKDDKTSHSSSKDKSKNKAVKNINEQDLPLKENKKSKKIKWFLLFVLIIGIAGGIYWRFFYDLVTVNPFELVEIQEKGVEGSGYLELKFKDYSSLDLDGVKEENYLKIIDNLTFKTDPDENLKTGDTVEIIAMYNDEETLKKLRLDKIKLAPMKAEYKLSMLTEPVNINIFDFVKVDYKFEDDEAKIDKISVDYHDKDLIELLEFDYPKKGLDFGHKYTLKIKKSSEMEDYLINKGLTFQSYEKELIVEDIVFVPESLSDIKEVEDLEMRTLAKIEDDYSKHQKNYRDFKIVSTCYANDVKNNVNHTDYFNGHSYENGSLMFIIEFTQEDGRTKNRMFDAYGFTNILSLNGLLDQEVMKEMSPYQEDATLESIKKELKENNFVCE